MKQMNKMVGQSSILATLRDGSIVKDTYYSCKRFRFGSQHLQWAAQTSFPGNLTPLLAFTGSNMHKVYMNLSRYIYTQKFFKTKILKTNILIIVNVLISYLLKRFILSAQEKDSRDLSTNHHNLPWSNKMMDHFFSALSNFR